MLFKIFSSLLLTAVIIMAPLTCDAKATGGYCKGIKLYGKVKVVKNFADLKVQVVKYGADLRVKRVKHFPDEIGEWQFVNNFPDFTIQYVDHFPDLKIQFVEHFPGVR